MVIHEQFDTIKSSKLTRRFLICQHHNFSMPRFVQLGFVCIIRFFILRFVRLGFDKLENSNSIVMGVMREADHGYCMQSTWLCHQLV